MLKSGGEGTSRNPAPQPRNHLVEEPVRVKQAPRHNLAGHPSLKLNLLPFESLDGNPFAITKGSSETVNIPMLKGETGMEIESRPMATPII